MWKGTYIDLATSCYFITSVLIDSVAMNVSMIWSNKMHTISCANMVGFLKFGHNE